MSLLQMVKLRPRKINYMSEVSGLICDKTNTFTCFTRLQTHDDELD